jgi:hypothetical protein
VDILGALRALAVVLAFVAGLLLAVGTISARTPSGQAVFVSGWMLVLVSGLVIVQNY